MKPKNSAILETEVPPAGTTSSTVVGARVTHRNAPERVGTIIRASENLATVEYLHEAEFGQEPVKTFALYNLADLTIVP